MEFDRTSTVGTIAVEAPASTRVFARHGIDYCCGGGAPLATACEQTGVDVETVLAELEEEFSENAPAERNWAAEPLTALIEHLLTAYHRPLDEELPRLEAMARKVHSVHGEKDPERLAALVETYVALRTDLEQHMGKEETILFPMIAQGRGAMAMGPVSVMRQEHETAGRLLARLRELTDDYAPPEAACTTWRALWHGLAELERSLHEHIHLENNILFPRALGSAGPAPAP